jgi:HipA-like C-terminal domain
LSRTLRGYVIERDTSIQGQAPKWVLRGPGGVDDFYIAKFGLKNGKVEVLTELFNNRLGLALGFNMAHSGIARLDQHLYFITRNFKRGEQLIHGSLLIAHSFTVAPETLDRIQAKAEQEFYSVDFIRDTILDYCSGDGQQVFQSFINMLMFDALIGSQDRHAMNWGVLRPEVADYKSGYNFRLAPLFDSARALLWDLPEGKLLRLDGDPEALLKYVKKSKPCIGPRRDHPKVNNCNHFDFISHLRALFPHQIAIIAGLLADKDVRLICQRLLKEFPFRRGFSPLRKRVILRVLETRWLLLREAMREGGTNHVEFTT